MMRCRLLLGCAVAVMTVGLSYDVLSREPPPGGDDVVAMTWHSGGSSIAVRRGPADVEHAFSVLPDRLPEPAQCSSERYLDVVLSDGGEDHYPLCFRGARAPWLVVTVCDLSSRLPPSPGAVRCTG